MFSQMIHKMQQCYQHKYNWHRFGRVAWKWKVLFLPVGTANFPRYTCVIVKVIGCDTKTVDKEITFDNIDRDDILMQQQRIKDSHYKSMQWKKLPPTPFFLSCCKVWQMWYNVAMSETALTHCNDRLKYRVTGVALKLELKFRILPYKENRPTLKTLTKPCPGWIVGRVKFSLF